MIKIDSPIIPTFWKKCICSVAINNKTVLYLIRVGNKILSWKFIPILQQNGKLELDSITNPWIKVFELAVQCLVFMVPTNQSMHRSTFPHKKRSKFFLDQHWTWHDNLPYSANSANFDCGGIIGQTWLWFLSFQLKLKGVICRCI